MNNNEEQQRKNYRTFELRGRTIIIDDFTYRRIFKDPDIKPKRKYRFIKNFDPAKGCPCMVLKAGKKRMILLSRYIMRAGEDEMVDHINRNPLDNRRCNLRIVNARQNMLNRRIKNNTGLVGVSVYINKKSFYVRTSFRADKVERLRFSCTDTPSNRIICALVRDKFVIQSGDDEYAPLNYPHLRKEPFRSRVLKTDISEFRKNKPAFFAKRFGIKISV